MIFFNNQFVHIWLKNVFTLKIMDFDNVFLAKVVDVYVIEGMNVWYTWYKIKL